MVNKDYKAYTKNALEDKFSAKGQSVIRAKKRQEKAVDDMMKDWMNGGHGLVQEKNRRSI